MYLFVRKGAEVTRKKQTVPMEVIANEYDGIQKFPKETHQESVYKKGKIKKGRLYVANRVVIYRIKYMWGKSLNIFCFVEERDRKRGKKKKNNVLNDYRQRTVLSCSKIKKKIHCLFRTYQY